MALKSKAVVDEKCKAPPGPPYSRTWMAGLIADTLKTADLVGSASRAGVSLLDVVAGRGRDPLFDAAMTEVDQVLRLAARANVLAAAAGGHLGSIRALSNGSVAELMDDGRPAHVFHGESRTPCPGCGHRLLIMIDNAQGWVQVRVHDLTAEFPRDGTPPRLLDNESAATATEVPDR